MMINIEYSVSIKDFAFPMRILRQLQLVDYKIALAWCSWQVPNDDTIHTNFQTTPDFRPF